MPKRPRYRTKGTSGRQLRNVRWAHLYELDYRTNVGTPSWYNRHTSKQRKLSAWRYLHQIAKPDKHQNVHIQGTKRGKSPSSNMTLKQMLASAKSLKKLSE